MLAGEQNRFLHLAEFAIQPELPLQAKIVVHEVHRVPLARREAYLKYMQTAGLALLKRHGFRPVGPWVTGVGNRSEVTYLFGYDSLAEREKLLTAFTQHADGRDYEVKVSDLADEATTRVLKPAAFAHRPADQKP